MLECEWGTGADEGRLEEELRKDTEKKIKAVCVVHNETTTGVTSDIAGVRKVCSPRLSCAAWDRPNVLQGRRAVGL